ncbi:MAG: hypothetical protein DA445_08365 [Bacteroidetes bacterium]|jgi:hypothetical protein|nr:hypothetical protein [Schleiferiaceae bacterium]PTL96937.1 MAG: hypothetical protein DA396_07540 [Bacteroidota bacterium]PTL99082.1 MAG: hypothetical protein DA440_07825 [Bacteroidota bacterium]PTM13611.1 MAG: hypothetical protein DA445_08365 [Bacteroidota bacterium]
MKLKVLVLLFTIGIAAQAQTIVRKDGTATGADSQVNDLSISNGLYLGLDDWRFGIQAPLVIFQEITDDSYDYESYLGIAPHLTVERLSSIPAFKWKGALGLSRGDSLGEFSQSGAYLAGGVRLDFVPVNFFFYEQSRSIELMAETILDVDPKYMLTLNAYQSVLLFDTVTLDFVVGAGYVNVRSWEEPGLQIRLGVGIGLGGMY